MRRGRFLTSLKILLFLCFVIMMIPIFISTDDLERFIFTTEVKKLSFDDVLKIIYSICLGAESMILSVWLPNGTLKNMTVFRSGCEAIDSFNSIMKSQKNKTFQNSVRNKRLRIEIFLTVLRQISEKSGNVFSGT